MAGILAGIKVVEFAGQGPGPFCGMLLADMGAEVILVERETSSARDEQLRSAAIFHRGKISVVLDLKDPRDLETALALVETADCLIEGMRPGVMERLGLGPEACMARNERLVYGRMTGWGQSGPLALVAGHDINYLALSGALWYEGMPGNLSFPPPTMLGDLGGGALYLAIGLLAGVMFARSTGKGQIVDAAIVDGAASLSNILLSLKAAGQLTSRRGESAVDGAHWYGAYQCSDGLQITICPIEPKFYAEFLERMELKDDWDATDQYNSAKWGDARDRLAEVFRQKPQREWRRLLEGTDCCFAPVLDLETAAEHPQLAGRRTFELANGFLQAAPAPRFSSFPNPPINSIPKKGEQQFRVAELCKARSTAASWAIGGLSASTGDRRPTG